MSITASVLILSTDDKIVEEAKLALDGMGETAPRFRLVKESSYLFESLRTQPISLVLIEFTEDPKELIRVVNQVRSASPPTRIAAILRPEGFPENVNESAALIDAMRGGVCDFLRRPLSTSDLSRLISQPSAAGNAGSSSTQTLGRVVSFISNKGGVGKSTLSTNAAVAIARRGQKSVLLIDGSIQMGVGAALLDLHPTATLTDLAREADRLDPTMIRQTAAIHSSGLHLLAAPADAVEAMEIDDLLIARIITLARQTYDVVIVDTFPMFDQVVIAALDLSDRVFVVLENVLPTLLGGAKLLSVLERIGYPAERQSIILNRQQRVTGSLSVDDVAERLQREIDHVLPFDKRVMAAANCGVPIATATVRLSGFSRALERLTDDVLGRTDSAAPRVEQAEPPLVAQREGQVPAEYPSTRGTADLPSNPLE
ncbi:AAA family ATPase [Allorhodopirellula solitaria]|uniref:Chromosome partitioning protein ParA n=1 Tax=Allorhodopirellula solitaria TaxID=2527987 RepID=A0A5C5YEC0_9BACT|nr:AAA family ATPase [Allorhodopirellula solitaria]TWT73328.1 Chromosome partitioning protein ParA [Allorhodopirellula solitaria]